MYYGTTYGKRGRVAVVTPVGGEGIIQILYRWCDPDIQFAENQVALKAVTKEGLQTMSDQVTENLHYYPEICPVDMVHFNCTTGSLVGGFGYDKQMCEKIKQEAKCSHATTATTAVLMALEAQEAKNISIVTPTPDDINAMEKAYFENCGYNVLSIHGHLTEDPRNPMLLPKIAPEIMYHFAVDHVDPKADTLFMSCCALNLMEIIDQLENRLSIPVIASNQCTVWAVGKFFGKHGPEAYKLGSLFTK